MTEQGPRGKLSSQSLRQQSREIRAHTAEAKLRTPGGMERCHSNYLQPHPLTPRKARSGDCWGLRDVCGYL